MTDIIIKTEKTPIETDFDPSASVNKPVMGSHDNEPTPAVENVAKETSHGVLPVKVEQPLTSEDLEKLNVKKELSQDEKAEIINPEVFNIF